MNKTRMGLFSLSLLAAALMAGCASQPKLTTEQVRSQFEQVARLETGLSQADSNGSEYLAPIGYRTTKKSLEKALDAAHDNNPAVANKAAAEGLAVLDKVNADTRISKDILGEVLSVRARAEKAGAPSTLADEFEEQEEKLTDTTELIEKNQTEIAKKRRPELIDGYSKLELAALKLGMMDAAKAAIENAKKQKAEKYAPKTLDQAREEVKLALSILDSDRTQTEKADAHSQKAKWLAERSTAITQMIKEYEERDFTKEDAVLWYQNQLTMVSQPLGGELPFNEKNSKVISALQQDINKVLEERNLAQADVAKAKIDITKTKAEMEKNAAMSQSEAKQKLALAQSQLRDAEAKTAALLSLSKEEQDNQQKKFEQEQAQQRKQHEQQLASSTQQQEEAARQREESARQEREYEARFEKVQSMFDDSEANVYRQRSNVLISAQGFNFPSGQSEMTADNFPLMNKLIQAIKSFPNPRIQVIGHTDSTGNDSTNQLLSQKRAEKVAKFFKEVGHIPGEHISVEGLGETKPVASNETVAGRAANRRVEIVIVNE